MSGQKGKAMSFEDFTLEDEVNKLFERMTDRKGDEKKNADVKKEDAPEEAAENTAEAGVTGTDGDEKKMSYEQAFAELEQLVSKMESGKLTLDESIKAYEEGTKLVKYCESELARYEAVIKKMTGQ
jgi:exodeoxyribonuclease VII small subunit